MQDGAIAAARDGPLLERPVARSGYRADIDGLRALAVVPVVLFHAKLGPFTGGFVGVDVFFVISGFLITQLLAGDIQRDRFSLVQFYERRVRRLFPALFAVMFCVAVAAAILFLPQDFRSVGRNIIAATLFVSNVGFWKQANYFDGPAETKPLLHTWSLAVEEQFYIVFPLLLAWLLRGSRERAIWTLWALACVSFAASVLMVTRDQATAFYIAPFRAWELLLGSLLALGAFPAPRSPVTREIVASLGAALILAACLGYSRLTLFPGASALLPCVGAALIIHGGSSGSPGATRLLSTRPFVFVGAISYSLYLWHWPLFVFAQYWAIHELTSVQSAGLALLSFVIAMLSWRFIEEPVRRSRVLKTRKALFSSAAAAMSLAVFAGGLIYAAQGLPARFPRQVAAISNYAFSLNPQSDRCGDTDLQLAKQSKCTIGDPSRASQFLIGDSHAGALYGALTDLARNGRSTVYGATPRCPPLLGIGTDDDCIRANQKKFEYILAHPEIQTVIVAARWSLYLSGRSPGPAETNGNLPELRSSDGRVYPQFTAAAADAMESGLSRLVFGLLKAGKQVVLVYPVPETGYDVPSTLARMRSRGQDVSHFAIAASDYRTRQRLAFKMLDGLGEHPLLKRVYPDSVLCEERVCRTSLNGEPLYFDSHHLSIPGARLLTPLLADAVETAGGASQRRAKP